MMWPLALLSLAVAVLGFLLFLASERKHSRAEKKAKQDAINDMQARLSQALTNHPDDIPLHCALRDALLRLQERK